MTKEKTLFGLSVGERVKYIANNDYDYDPIIHNAKGTIMDIYYPTGEYYVKLDNQSVCNYAFLRYELLRDGENLDDTPFDGVLLKTMEMSIGEVRNYLVDYHSFIEGRDFSVTEKKDMKEVFLHPKKYSQLISDLISLKEVTEKMIEDKIFIDIKDKLRSEIIHGECVTLFFKQAGWTFRTQVSYPVLYESVLAHYGVDIDV